MKTIFLTVFSLICFSVSAQVDAFQQEIINYLEINGTPEQYEDAYDGMFDVLKQNFQTANVPDEVWTQLAKNKDESIDEVIKFLSFAYRKHFTQSEISQLTDFYKRSAAQKMVTREGGITEGENAELTDFFKSDLGKKVEATRNALAVDITEISSHWSRDLFAVKMSELIQQGYSPQQ